MTKNRLRHVIDSIGQEFEMQIERGSRHYIEVSIGRQADKLGYTDLRGMYDKIYAIVPLKKPQKGMKVRIDGRTFVNYAEYDSGVAVPGYLAKVAGQPYHTYVPLDSMICNFA
jgi:hypothetical protein